MSHSSLFRFIVSILFGLVPSAFGADDTLIRTPKNYATFVPPAARSSYTDTAFGVSIKRLSDARNTPNTWLSGLLDFVSTEYPGASPFNSDNSRLILQHQGYYGLYTGSGDYLKDLPFVVHAATEPRWSRSEPDVLYYVSVNRLMKLNVAAGASSVVRSFGEYAAIRGRGESDISGDGDHFVFAADDLPDGPTEGLVNRYVFVYEISTNTKGPALDTTGHPFNSLYLAPDNSVALGWSPTGSARFTGVELFDRNMVFKRQLTHALGHMHLTREAGGDDVLVWTNSNDPAPLANCQNGIVKVRLKDAVQTCLLQLDWSLAVHITAPDQSGWVFVETYDPTDPLPGTSAWKLYTNEILQVKLDGSETRRLFHHRSRRTVNYALQPRAAVSRDGSRLVFSSNYGLGAAPGHPGDYTDAYLATVPLATPPRLSISDAVLMEGDVGTSAQSLTLTLSHPSDLRVSVSYTTVDGTASAPSDYAAVATTFLEFVPGETTKTIAMTVNSDTESEPTEVFFLDLKEPVNASLGGGGQVTIMNDDLAPTAITGAPTAISQTGATLTGMVNPLGKTATAVFDYGPAAGAAGQRVAASSPGSGSVPVTVTAPVTGLPCSTKHRHQVTAISAAGTTVGTPSFFTTAACDGLSIDDPSILEGDSHHAILAFTLSLSTPSALPVTVRFTTGNGTGIVGDDYVAESGTLTVPGGATSMLLAIRVRGDTALEGDETLTVTLSAAVGAVIGKAVGIGTILNDDPSGPASPVTQYRLYHEGTKEHLYTTDANEYEVLGRLNWAQEGIAYELLTSGTVAGVATIPLFRLYHPGTQQHHWTTDSNEAVILSGYPDWLYESTVGYLLPVQTSGAVPLYRMAFANPPLHLWTTDRNEYETLTSRGWVPEGIVGYVFPVPGGGSPRSSRPLPAAPRQRY